MSMIGWVAVVPEAACDAIAAGRIEIDRAVAVDDVTDDSEDAVCVEKLWHAIHFLISDGCVWESDGKLGELFMGGEEGSEDFGYGPPRYHAPARVTKLHRWLSALPNEELHKRFDPRALAGSDIYPTIWDENPDELWEEIVGYLDPLRALIARAEERGEGLLVWIS